ncbi:hypothetical protein BHM03_00042170 [Ensete ventricosum]|nr:hypothetical protein BHM03_00042170 [Ensete ventricosum]
MMEWGLLPLNEAKKVYEKKLKKAQQQKLSSPVKVASIKKTSTTTVKQVPKTISKTVTKILKKQKASDSEADNDDFIMPKKINKQKITLETRRRHYALVRSAPPTNRQNNKQLISMDSDPRPGTTTTERNTGDSTVQLADLGVVAGVDAVADGEPRVSGDDAVVRSRDRDARPSAKGNEGLEHTC